MSPQHTNTEVVHTLESFIRTSGKKKFLKSDLRAVGISPVTAHEWFKLIEHRQTNFPRIRVIEVEPNVIIEVLSEDED